MSLGRRKTAVAMDGGGDPNMVWIADGNRRCNAVAKQMRINWSAECLLGEVHKLQLQGVGRLRPVEIADPQAIPSVSVASEEQATQARIKSSKRS
jgi:hypothetical protein